MCVENGIVFTKIRTGVQSDTPGNTHYRSLTAVLGSKSYVSLHETLTKPYPYIEFCICTTAFLGKMGICGEWLKIRATAGFWKV